MGYGAAAMAGVSILNGVMQAKSASDAAAAQRTAATQQAALQLNEANIQETQLNKQAGEQIGDRAAQADRDASTLRVLMGERGASANATSRSMQELGYYEGLDMSRIEDNRKNRFRALETSKTAALMGESNVITVANNQEQTAKTGAFLGTLGSMVQIGANDYKTQKYDYILSGGQPSGFTYHPFGIGSG